MDISCQHCGNQIKIPDEKVPKGKAFSLGCPKCKKKIAVPASQPQAKPQAQPQPPAEKKKTGLVDEVASSKYDADDRPFEYLEEGEKTALLCELDPAYRAKISAALKSMEYRVTEPQSARDALKQMRFHQFDMIVLNDRFDTDDPENNHVLKFISRMSISTRRSIFVALMTEGFRSMDNMAAFAKSVNVVINPKNIDDVQKILARAVSDNTAFYRVYWESMRKVGRI